MQFNEMSETTLHAFWYEMMVKYEQTEEVEEIVKVLDFIEQELFFRGVSL